MIYKFRGNLWEKIESGGEIRNLESPPNQICFGKVIL